MEESENGGVTVCLQKLYTRQFSWITMMAKMIGMFGKVDYREESLVYWDWNFGS